MNRSIAYYILLGFILSNQFVDAQKDNAQSKKPNILFIFSDDQMPDSIGAYGSEVVKTPNLDRLAARGVLFNHAYNQGSFVAAVCVSSRTMLNTGSFVWNAAGYTPRSKFVPGSKNVPRVGELYTIKETKPEAFWSQYMKRAGYETYFSGKWHVQVNASEIFDHVLQVRGGMPRQHDTRYQRTFIEGEPDIWSSYDTDRGGFWQGGKHWSELLADDGVILRGIINLSFHL